MIRDILSEIVIGKITEDEADQLYDTIIKSDKSPCTRELIGLSEAEWTAFSHGVSFGELSNWRFFGWPDSCPICGEKIIRDNFGWFVKENSNGEHLLIHVNCLS